MNLKPVLDYVLVKPDTPALRTKAGLHLPAESKVKHHQPETGTVLAVGPGRVGETGERVPVRLAEGDRVLFKRIAGWDHTVEGVRCHFLREGEVLGIIKENP